MAPGPIAASPAAFGARRIAKQTLAVKAEFGGNRSSEVAPGGRLIRPRGLAQPGLAMGLKVQAELAEHRSGGDSRAQAHLDRCPNVEVRMAAIQIGLVAWGLRPFGMAGSAARWGTGLAPSPVFAKFKPWGPLPISIGERRGEELAGSENGGQHGARGAARRTQFGTQASFGS